MIVTVMGTPMALNYAGFKLYTVLDNLLGDYFQKTDLLTLDKPWLHFINQIFVIWTGSKKI